MQSPYDAELRAEIRQRMSPPNRESVAEIARTTGRVPLRGVNPEARMP